MPSKLTKLLEAKKTNEFLLPALKQAMASHHAKVASGKLSRKHFTLNDARMTVVCMKERIKEYNHGDTPEHELFHPSQIGTCLRRMAYGAENAPRNTAPSFEDILRSHLTFETGTYTHVLFQNLCEYFGFLKSREVSIVNPNDKIIGHADGIVAVNGVEALLEIKTINSRGFSALLEPKPEHRSQMMLYMHSLGMRLATIIYLEKDRHGVKEYTVPYDPTHYKDLRDNRIEFYFKHRRAGTLPPREGKDPNRMPCMYCEFSRLCFDTRASAAWESKYLKPTKNPVRKNHRKETPCDLKPKLKRKVIRKRKLVRRK